jgi:hypothetical protein
MALLRRVSGDFGFFQLPLDLKEPNTKVEKCGSMASDQLIPVIRLNHQMIGRLQLKVVVLEIVIPQTLLPHIIEESLLQPTKNDQWIFKTA